MAWIDEAELHTSRPVALVEIDFDSDTRKYSIDFVRPIGDPAYKGNVLGLPTIYNSVGDLMRAFEFSKIAIEFSDTDYEFRTLVEAEGIKNRQVTIKIAFPNRSLATETLTVFVGNIYDWDPKAGLKFVINCEQKSKNMSNEYPDKVVERGDYANAHADALGKVIPIIWGTISQAGGAFPTLFVDTTDDAERYLVGLQHMGTDITVSAVYVDGAEQTLGVDYDIVREEIDGRRHTRIEFRAVADPQPTEDTVVTCDLVLNTDFQISACDAIPGWTAAAGGVLSIDAGDKKEGTGSLKNTVAAPGAPTDYWTSYSDPTGTLDLSDKKHILFWLKSDRASAAFTLPRLLIQDTLGNYRYWTLTFLAGVWTAQKLLLSTGTGESGTPPNLTIIDRIRVYFTAADGIAFYKKIDYVRVTSNPYVCEAIKYFMINFCGYVDGDFNDPSYQAAHIIEQNRGFTFNGAFTIKQTLSTILNGIKDEFELDMWWEPKDGLIHFNYLSSSVDLSTLTHYKDTFDILKGYRPGMQVEKILNYLRYGYNYNYAHDYWFNYDHYEHTASQAKHGGTYTEFSGFRFVRNSTVAYDLASRKVLRRKDPVVFDTFPLPLKSFEDDLAEVVKITHFEGMGATGYEERLFQIRKTSYDIDKFVNSMIAEDVDAFFGLSCILGDATALPVLWANAVGFQRNYCYLCDSGTGQFSDGEPGKELRD